MVSILVPAIVLAIVLLQIFFFFMNVNRMKEYKQIFENQKSWKILHDEETNFVSGINGDGNSVFSSIKDSINKYLGNNSGSVIDFQLLKDSVDRHCDVVENDVNTLTPVPLYCGLAGTMAGVIIGLSSLLSTGSITALLSSGSGDFGTAAIGVNELLKGVAWAMLASICGIFLTTISSILFKRYKLEGESGKNTFLAWLQSRLLPELPSDTSDALNRLVKNLNKFNSTFANNTTELRGALQNVNESYRIQANIIQAVHDMDVMKMAKANVRVLQELKECTDKLELFNQYLNDIHGYTNAIHTFTSQFEVEANRLHVLEEIQQFFTRHKEEIVKDSADIDVALSTALRQLKESTGNNITELNNAFVKQAEEFKQILVDERNSFERVNREIQSQFSSKINQMPMLEEKLSEVSRIPDKIDEMIQRLETANSKLYSAMAMSLGEMAKKIADNLKQSATPEGVSLSNQPKKTSKIVIISVIIIAIACVVNTAHNIWSSINKQENAIEQLVNELPDEFMEGEKDSTLVDSTAIHLQQPNLEKETNQGDKYNNQ